MHIAAAVLLDRADPQERADWLDARPRSQGWTVPTPEAAKRSPAGCWRSLLAEGFGPPQPRRTAKTSLYSDQLRDNGPSARSTLTQSQSWG